MKAGIFYYSYTGNTARIAEGLRKGLLAQEWEVDLVRLKPARPSSLFIDVFRALCGSCAPIEPETVNLEEYGLVFLGTPVWARNPTPYVNQFIVQQQGWSGKSVVLFVTMQGSGDKYVLGKLARRLTRKGAKIIDTFSTSIGRAITPEHIRRATEFATALSLK